MWQCKGLIKGGIPWWLMISTDGFQLPADSHSDSLSNSSVHQGVFSLLSSELLMLHSSWPGLLGVLKNLSAALDASYCDAGTPSIDIIMSAERASVVRRFLSSVFTRCIVEKPLLTSALDTANKKMEKNWSN